MITFVLALLIWFIAGGLFASFMQHLVIKLLPRSRHRMGPSTKIGFVTSLIRMTLICFLCVTILDCTLQAYAIKMLVFADVLCSALHAHYAVRRYGFYARRSGFRTGANLGSLCFGVLFLLFVVIL